MEIKIDIPRTLKRLGVQKNSQSLKDYEMLKRWLFYQPIDQDDLDKYLKEVVEYINV